jgi:hypothetical protein
MFILRGTFLGELVCCVRSLIAVGCEDECGVLELALLLPAKMISWSWNSHCCRLRGRVWGSGTLIAVDCEDGSVVLELPLLMPAKTISRSWNSHCCRLRGRVWGSGALITVDLILLLEWYYKEHEQFIRNAMEY